MATIMRAPTMLPIEIITIRFCEPQVSVTRPMTIEQWDALNENVSRPNWYGEIAPDGKRVLVHSYYIEGDGATTIVMREVW